MTALELVAALATYRIARRQLLLTAGREASNRDPVVEWGEALVEAVLGAPRVTSRVEPGHDLRDRLGRRIEVKTLSNSPGTRWVNEHAVWTHPGRDLCAIVVLEDLAPLGILVLDLAHLAALAALLAKRGQDRAVHIDLTEANLRAILADPSSFVPVGVTVYGPPDWEPASDPVEILGS